MDSDTEHNQLLQQMGMFSPADLEENKQGRYSQTQLKRFESERDFFQSSAKNYENKSPLISLIFGSGLIVFAAILYFVGVFDSLKSILGGLFLPLMLGVLIVALIFVFVIVPRQYESSVNAFKAMGTPLPANPLGEIQVIEAQAETFASQPGINRRGHQSGKVTYILQMDTIKFMISKSLFEVIKLKHIYRVFAVKDQGVWILLSMEAVS